MDANPAEQSRWQFTIRGLLKFTALVAVYLGFVARSPQYGAMAAGSLMLALLCAGGFRLISSLQLSNSWAVNLLVLIPITILFWVASFILFGTVMLHVLAVFDVLMRMTGRTME